MDKKQAEALKVLAALTARALEQGHGDGDCHDDEDHQETSGARLTPGRSSSCDPTTVPDRDLL